MKIRTNLTLEDGLIAKAKTMLAAEHYNNLSEYLEQLIRNEWNRRNPPPLTKDEMLLALLVERVQDATAATPSPTPAVQSQSEAA